MLQPVHIHLLLNHIPVLGTLFAIFLLLYGIIRKNYSLTNAGLVTLIITGIVTIFVFNSGEGAEETMESLGVDETFIEAHESAADYAMWGALLLGGIALLYLGLHLVRKEVHRIFSAVILIGSFVLMGLMVWTAYLGGQIRHTEIRKDGTIPAKTQSTIEQATSNHEHEEEED